MPLFFYVVLYHMFNSINGVYVHGIEVALKRIHYGFKTS